MIGKKLFKKLKNKIKMIIGVITGLAIGLPFVAFFMLFLRGLGTVIQKNGAKVKNYYEPAQISVQNDIVTVCFPEMSSVVEPKSFIKSQMTSTMRFHVDHSQLGGQTYIIVYLHDTNIELGPIPDENNNRLLELQRRLDQIILTLSK